MARIHIRKEIVIDHNPVERYIIKVKDFVRDNRKIVLVILSVVLALGVILISSLVAISITTENRKAEFEVLTEKYQKYKIENDIEKAKKTVDEMRNLSEKSWFGFVAGMGLYYAGNYYYDLGDYEKSRATLEKFIGGSKKNAFWELASLKIGVIYQEMNNPDKALESYKKLEAGYKEGIILDQLFYNMASVYALKNDKANARKYYNRVIGEHAQSPFAAKAKKRLFVLWME